MRKQTLQFDNLGEVLGSARNATLLGTQQFFTPQAVADALMIPLTPYRGVVADLQCGHGALLRAASADHTRDLLGLDIDSSAAATGDGSANVFCGDVTRVFPLLKEANCKFDLLVLNPPFSLLWDVEIESASFLRKNGIDSTLATYLMAMDLLTPAGEGMMICNAATAKRLILTKENPFASKIWLQLELPNFFAGTHSNMRIAVLYFAKDHRPFPEDDEAILNMESAAPDAITAALSPFAMLRRRIIRGNVVDKPFRASGNTADRWRAVRQEWERIVAEEAGERDGWNIRIGSDGRINAWLTPFQKISGKVPVELAKELQAISGHFPEALVVQKASRIALHRAVSGGIWRVHSDVAEAVEKAMLAYNAVRAPYVRLNTVQRLGYLDENDSIECLGGIEGFTKGQKYPLESHTFEGKQEQQRKRVVQDEEGDWHENTEDVLVTGMELAIFLRDNEMKRHCFTQFETQNPLPADFYHPLADLVECFVIPDVPDVAACRPDVYAEYLRRLRALETAA